MNVIKRLLYVCLLSVLSSGCITSGVVRGVEERAAEIRKGAKQLPHRNLTDFSESLRCMDNMFISFGIGTGDYAVLLEEMPDKTKKVDAGTRNMALTAISEMTSRSGAIRLVNYSQDTGNLITIINAAGKTGIYENIPPFNIVGSISQYDDGVFRKQADVSSEIAGTVDGSSVGGGGGRSASSSVTFMTMDLGIITTHNLSILPGVNTKNTVELFSRGSSTSFDGGISKTGMSYSFSNNSKDAVGQALRGLVELSTIELIGKLTKVPYWKCLGMDPEHVDIKRLVSDWFYQLNNMGILHRTIKMQLKHRGYYAGEISEDVTEDYLLAIVEYKRRLGLPDVASVDLDFYSAFLGRMPISEDRATLAYAKRSHELKLSETKKAKKKKAKKEANKEASKLKSLDIELELVSLSGDQFSPGEEVSIQVRTNTDGYMSCYFQKNDAFVRVFPNRFSADGYISSKGGLILPDSNGYSFVAGVELEKVHCFLATKSVDTELPAELQVPDLEQLPVYSLDVIKQAYATVTDDHFGMASFEIATQ